MDLSSTSFWTSAARSTAVLAGAVIVAAVVHRVAFRLAHRLAQRSTNPLDDAFVRQVQPPFRLILPLAAIALAVPALQLSAEVSDLVSHALGLGFIAAVAWLVIAAIAVADDYVTEKYRTDVRDNLHARAIGTQAAVLRRIATVLTIIIAAAMMLMTFPTVRQVGASMLASAGLAGLVVGFAARPTLSNLIAGLQIALTEPIRLDDVVIVQGEWGRIEEIGTTYVVVRIWDLRRLIVPLSYFIEQPFQNWTRQSADLLGTVFLYVDYTVPVDDVRAELQRLLDGNPLWDGKTWALQVTDATEHTVQLRALMGAHDSGSAFDLRCQVRERLLGYLQTHYPQSLPRVRAELHPMPAVAAG